MSIHQNLRWLRANSGMTQEQVAEQLGVTRQALSSYESGRTRPDIDMLLRMCQVYQTDLEGIVYGKNETLRWERWVKNAAIFVGITLLALTVINSALRWSGSTFFPINGLVTENEAENVLLENRIRLNNARDAVERIVLLTAPLGALMLLVMSQSGKYQAKAWEKLLYLAALAGGLLLLQLPFALTDHTYSLSTYLYIPTLVMKRVMLFFAIDFMICLIKSGRKHKKDQSGI